MRKILLALVFTLAVHGQKRDALMSVPRWFSLLEPENQKVTEKSADRIGLSYDAATKFGDVVGYYETSLHEAPGITFEESGDVRGATFEIHAESSRCRLSIGNQEKPHVEFSCASTVVVAPAPVTPVMESKIEKPAHRIEYVIEGSAKSAGLTYRNAQGRTEQREVALPARLSIETGAEASFFVAAQKKNEEGTLRVVVNVDGKRLREASSSSPYGIASVSGKLAN